MSYECNIFKGASDVDCSNVVPVMGILTAIRNGRWKDRVEEVRNMSPGKARDAVKQRLPAAIFSGVFEEREDDACVLYNQIMVVDIDDLPKSRLPALKSKMQEKPWVIAYFEGVTKGIKILVSVDSDSTMHRDHAFPQIEEYFMDNYKVKIDRKCKNLSRLCFVSYDPEAYIAESFTPMQIDRREDEFSKFVKVHKQANSERYEQVMDAKKIFDTSIKMVKKSKTGSYHKGNRNNFVFTLACLCGEFGVDPTDALMMIYERYSSLDFKEIKTTVESAYRRIQHKFGTKIINERTTNQSKLL
jgi:hypothetical protein